MDNSRASSVIGIDIEEGEGWRTTEWISESLYRKATWDMTINLIFKIAAVGILVSVLGQVLKHSGRDEQAFLVSLAGLILVLLWVVPYILELFETIQSLFAL